MNFQKKILVIDGDKDFWETIKDPLAFHNYNACYASDGASGIQKALEFNPDLILCDINTDPIDGCQVYKLLWDSFLLKGVPFVFLKQNATFEDVRQGLNFGADDFLTKPINIHDLITSIEVRLKKFKTSNYQDSHEFNTLFQLSPIGIIIFSEHAVIRANSSIKGILKIDNQRFINIRIDDLFENSSLLRIKSWIQQSVNGDSIIFNDCITIKDILAKELEMNLVLYDFSNSPDFNQFIGFFTPLIPVNSYLINDQLANQVCNLLKREKIAIPDDLEEKITYLIKQRTLSYNNQNNSFFSKRENQVLCLSMEGMPIKTIADKLSISSRTVEKHRTKLMEKSGSNNIVAVIVFAIKNGLIKI